MSDRVRKTKLTYRPDIDGLRAIAVLLVLFDHLRTQVTGGYIGVDVFFVISGYLISSVIVSDIEADRFSVLNFYERRIRRIFPALFLMLLVSSVFAYRFLLPSEVENFGRSLLASVFSVSNMLFWRQAGYFDVPSAFKPLLHTWSLAVEEQFYIFFPLFLIAVRRWFRPHLKAAIWTITAVTFIMACYFVQRAPTAAFFIAPLRAWELLIGTIISQRYLPPIEGKSLRNIASLTGLTLILLPAFRYTSETSFPGLAALPACLGAALLIAGGETGNSIVGRVLASRPFVFIGLISYSLYLCHWPILVFRSRAFMLSEHDVLDLRARVEILIASILAATISWRFVETPFRKGVLKPGRRSLFLVNSIAGVSIVLIALIMIASHGLPSRFPANAVSIASFTTYHPAKEWREGICFLTPESNFGDFRTDTCLRTDSTRENLLLFGDSLAAQLYPGLVSTFPELNILQANAADCRPLLTEPVMAPLYAPNCYKMSTYIFQNYLPHHHVDAVLLAGNWHESLLPELGRTIEWIKQHGMVPIIFGPSIEYDTSLPRILAFSARYKDSSILDRHRVAKAPKLDHKMADLARYKWKVRYISVFDYLCAPQIEIEAKLEVDKSRCPVYAAPGVPLTFDEHHLTVEGSKLYGKAMRTGGEFSMANLRTPDSDGKSSRPLSAAIGKAVR